MLKDFTVGENYASFRPVERLPLNAAIELIRMAIAHCGEHKIRLLLVDTTGLSGFAVPGTLDRYSMSEQFASAAAPGMKVAVVAKSEMIDPQRFGVTVARNRGLRANVFSTEDEALEWLLDDRRD